MKLNHFRNLFLFFLLSGPSVFSACIPISGTYTINGTSTPYPTISSAISALNGNGVGAGGVIFIVTGGYAETFPNATSGLINISCNNPTALNPIVFKNGGAPNPLITAATGTGGLDGIIVLSGTDFITF